MEYDCNHWSIWYDFVSVNNNEFVDPRAETQFNNWAKQNHVVTNGDFG